MTIPFPHELNTLLGVLEIRLSLTTTIDTSGKLALCPMQKKLVYFFVLYSGGMEEVGVGMVMEEEEWRRWLVVVHMVGGIVAVKEGERWRATKKVKINKL